MLGHRLMLATRKRVDSTLEPLLGSFYDAVGEQRIPPALKVENEP
jgi:hypothetical protein